MSGLNCFTYYEDQDTKCGVNCTVESDGIVFNGQKIELAKVRICKNFNNLFTLPDELYWVLDCGNTCRVMHVPDQELIIV